MNAEFLWIFFLAIIGQLIAIFLAVAFYLTVARPIIEIFNIMVNPGRDLHNQ